MFDVHSGTKIKDLGAGMTCIRYSISIFALVCRSSVGYSLYQLVYVYPALGHFGAVRCVCAHPSMPRLYTGGKDTNILVWDAPSHYLKDQPDGEDENVNDEDDWSDDDRSNDVISRVNSASGQDILGRVDGTRQRVNPGSFGQGRRGGW